MIKYTFYKFAGYTHLTDDISCYFAGFSDKTLLMTPVYLDLHIHTSDNPDKQNLNYDLALLVKKIQEYNQDADFLISFTDHNFINEKTYLEAVGLGINIIIGVELHIRNYDNCPAYHCHIFFDLPEITKAVIEYLNERLDELYPVKVVEKKDLSIPTIQDIINKFDSYEFILLPHGGQSHAMFDSSIPAGVQFDTMLEKSIYYNQFDGFTARGDTKLEKTQDYFKKLGISEFVNLVTCSDNYNPAAYPNGKDANPFKPTWMLAQPTFNGLRLSLSEQSRLIYSYEKPKFWSENIRSVKHKGNNIEIDVDLTPGLNVIIGGSSSGKTLLVDSIAKSIRGNMAETIYGKYEVDKIIVDNPSGMVPHYLSQNYIMSVVSGITENKIENIDIISRVFPGDQEIKESIQNGLRDFKTNVQDLCKNLKILEQEKANLGKIPVLSRLLVAGDIDRNIFDNIVPTENEIVKLAFSKGVHDKYIEQLDEIDRFLNIFPFVNHDASLVQGLKDEIQIALISSSMEKGVRKIVTTAKADYDEQLKLADSEDQTKNQHFQKLLGSLRAYIKAYREFFKTIEVIANYALTFDTEEIESMGHKLYIENDFALTKEKFVEVINHYLKEPVLDFRNITPELLFDANFKKQKPKVHDHDDFEKRIYNDFEGLNRKKYKITTSDAREFDDLSPGWKTSVILDLILGYDKDISPVIIDQPEDNLATNYINKGLVEAIKKIKAKKQIILVSHNATIPMLADAQNIVLCRNDNNRLLIKSSCLEGQIEGKSMVDHIAEITDGGKASIKKRVKKYNLKKFNDSL